MRSRGTRYRGGSVRSLLVRVAEWIIDLEGEPVLFETPLPQNLTARKRRGCIKSDVVRPECRSQTKQSGHGKILVVATRKVIFRPTGQTCRYKVGPSFRAIEQKRCEFRGQNVEDPPRSRTHLFANDSQVPCGCVYLRLRFQEQILRSRTSISHDAHNSREGGERCV